MPDNTLKNSLALEVPAASIDAIAAAVLKLVDDDLQKLAGARIDAELERRSGSPTGLLSVSEVATLLGVHPRTVYRALTSGELVGVRVGSAWRVRRAEVDAWLQRQNERRALPRARRRPAPPAGSYRMRAHHVEAGR